MILSDEASTKWRISTFFALNRAGSNEPSCPCMLCSKRTTPITLGSGPVQVWTQR